MRTLLLSLEPARYRSSYSTAEHQRLDELVALVAGLDQVQVPPLGRTETLAAVGLAEGMRTQSRIVTLGLSSDTKNCPPDDT